MTYSIFRHFVFIGAENYANLSNVAKSIYTYSKVCFHYICNGGAVVESPAVDPRDVGSPPACAL